ncbi:MAG: phage tail protein [Chitinophaga sp.]|uniref:phage tail protein n=1 Tax=Chitinophaga sp. TaxID=1869181 RepID=UPI001B13DE02|nr:tail fiber protein [Chitinophaga sp.]MBO9731414.1 phage tail protein [Chitinophaga sp.]
MPFIGEIRIFAGDFPPAGWAFCQGQILPISENDTLFALIGDKFGGDGQTTFALPDLQGRVPLHFGNGYAFAAAGGLEEVTIQANQLPPHRHNIEGDVFIPVMGANPGTQLPAKGNYPAITSGNKVYSTVKDLATTPIHRLAPLTVVETTATTMMTVQGAGGSLPKYNMQPYLVINFIISLYGVFPSQT